MENLLIFVQTLVVLTLLGVALKYGNQRLVRYYDGRPHLKVRQQLIQIGGSLFIILLLILTLPINETMQGNLLSFYGIIVSATIALSSTTLVGNILAGIMLKAVGNCRPGNYITVGDHFGRISEMDLLHTELQTEDRDLTTLPNLYLVTNPVRVMRKSGTLIHVELSLGYEVSRHRIEEILISAATEVELESPFVQIRELGDFSVTYRVSGVLKEDNRLLEKRRDLRARTLDMLHDAGIEVVSPNFMNTRAIADGQNFIAQTGMANPKTGEEPTPDSVVFDKAEKAESIEKLREHLNDLQAQLQKARDVVIDRGDERAVEAAAATIAETENRIERLKLVINRREQKIAAE